MIKKTMKLFALVVAFVISIYPLSYKKANAVDDNFLRVITCDTPLYKSVYDTTPLCYLPYTYYVEVLEMVDEFAHVKCFDGEDFPAIDGYVPKALLFDDDLPKDNPYLLLKIKTSATAVLYKDAMMTVKSQYIFSDRELYYYGSLDSGEGKIFLVGYNNTLGYVDESVILPFTIENHPNKLTFIPEEKPPEEKPETQNDHQLSIRIIIILCIALAGIIALVVVLSKKPGKNNVTNYYDENDYE